MVCRSLCLTVALRYQNIIFIIVVLTAAWYSLERMHHNSLSHAWWLHTAHRLWRCAASQVLWGSTEDRKRIRPGWPLPRPSRKSRRREWAPRQALAGSAGSVALRQTSS